MDLLSLLRYTENSNAYYYLVVPCTICELVHFLSHLNSRLSYYQNSLFISLSERLRLKKACDYTYLNQSDCLEINDVDDAQNLHMLMVMQPIYCLWCLPSTCINQPFLPLVKIMSWEK